VSLFNLRVETDASGHTSAVIHTNTMHEVAQRDYAFAYRDMLYSIIAEAHHVNLLRIMGDPADAFLYFVEFHNVAANGAERGDVDAYEPLGSCICEGPSLHFSVNGYIFSYGEGKLSVSRGVLANFAEFQQ
jgi:hypothetical protein